MRKRLNQSVARKIFPQGGSPEAVLSMSNGEARNVNCTMRRILSGLRIPMKPYQVTYVLDFDGPFRVGPTGGGIRLRTDGPYELGMAVCFLPPHFANKRVRREVRI
jgi:hypothetical protein